MRLLASLAGLLGLSACGATVADPMALALDIFTRGGTYRTDACIPGEGAVTVILPGGQAVDLPWAMVAAAIGAETCR